jgi:hypothetical protein
MSSICKIRFSGFSLILTPHFLTAWTRRAMFWWCS